MYKFLIGILFFCISLLPAAQGQIEFGYVFGLDGYQRMVNPESESVSRGSGNALLNPFIGPKIWLGGKEFSLSLEAQVNLGITSLSRKDYKGLGAVSFPLMAKLNFMGMTGMDRQFEWGFYVGGGMQWSRTELYYLSQKYRELDVQRNLFPTYVAEIGIGRGGFGVDGSLYGRYGFDPDTKASTLHIGFIFNFLRTFDRFPSLGKEKKPDKLF